MPTRSYIAAIAGLRSLAVLSIVLYHLDPAWLPGGFVGVDVFFVISGFVVAHSVSGRPHERFRDYVAWFYKRRVQRILPAAFVYIAIVALLSMLFVPMATPTRFIEITGATAAFAVSNVFLWLTANDYFAAATELNLFTHTWSLALEEQYYLFFPFFSYPLFASAKASAGARRFALAFIVVACLASLAAAVWFSLHAPTFAFYMLPARFWELGIGFLLRLALNDANSARITAGTRNFGSALALLGLGALTAAFIVTDPRGFPFPGALLPCLATALLITVVWCHPGLWLDRLLSHRVPVWFGQISYSLYLWHWGVIVLMKWTIGLDTLPLRLTAFVLMLALGHASYRYVESLFHNQAQRRQPPSLGLFLRYGGAASAVAALCLGAYALKPRLGLAAADRVAIWDPYRAPPLPADCPTAKQVGNLGVGKVFTFPARCTAPQAPHLFIVGDSHAGAYQRSAWRIAATGRYRVTLFTKGGCRLVELRAIGEVPGCADFLDRVADRIRHDAGRGDVILLAGLQVARFRPEDAGQPTAPDPQTIAASRRRLQAWAGLGPAILVEGIKPIALAPLYRCADWFDRNNPECRSPAGASQAEMLRRMARVDAGLVAAVRGIGKVTVWEPRLGLCTASGCPDHIDGKPLFFDADHLTAYANDRLLPLLVAAVDTASAGEAP